jgi:hypothetical protein
LSDEGTKAEKFFSGRVLIRMPASLHRELANAASNDGVSLNQFACALLASGVGWRRGESERRGASENNGIGDRFAPETGWTEHNSLVSDEQYSDIWWKRRG